MKYYIREKGETVDQAVEIGTIDDQHTHYNAEIAAIFAIKDQKRTDLGIHHCMREISGAGGFQLDVGFGGTFSITLVSSSGQESDWEIGVEVYPELKVSAHRTVRTNSLTDVKVGDIVTRFIAGSIPMKLKITDVLDKVILCGSWMFDRQTGYEIDEDLGWGNNSTGSYIVVEER